MPDSTNTKRTGFISARIEGDLLRRLEEIARRNDRSVSAELRRVIREYVERAEVAK